MRDVAAAPEFEQLVALIRLRTGLGVSDTKTEDIVAAIKTLIRTNHLSGISALLTQLSEHSTTSTLWQDFIHIVTVGETYFFRNEAQFEALRQHIFPALIKKRREANNRFLRLWCAGCATGEEPYSLAILLRELLPDYQTWQITLIASDINLVSLEHARRGVYRAWSFRNETPPSVRQNWFVAAGDTYTLDSSVKNMVTFGLLNLVTDQYPSFESGISGMDLIMCRNVTIYFDQETTRQIACRLYQTLNTNGWLVVGHAEPSATVYSDFTPRNFPNTVIYQKNPPPLESSEAARPDVTLEPPKIKPAITPTVSAPGKKPKTVHHKSQPEKPLRNELPSPTKSLWQQAKAAADLENWQEALVLLIQAETQDKFQPQVFYMRAIVQIHLDDLPGAHASLRQALYCDPQFVLAHYSLGELFEKAGDYKNAVRHWKSAQSALVGLEPKSQLLLADELTVEMLQGLLTHALQRTANRTNRT